MTPLTLSLLPDTFTIHRLSPRSPLPENLYRSIFFSLTQSADELSVVCKSTIKIASRKQEDGWSCLRVEGVLDFGLTGILADLSGILADAGISIFAVSTYDTDYLLVKTETLTNAVAALHDAGHTVQNKHA